MGRGSYKTARCPDGNGTSDTGTHATSEETGHIQGGLPQHLPRHGVEGLLLGKKPDKSHEVIAHVIVRGGDHGKEGVLSVVVVRVAQHLGSNPRVES